MAISNRQAAGAYGGRVRWDNEKARRGGRPLGAKDGAGIVRKGTAKEKQEALQAELGKAKQRIEELENELQYGVKFKGTPKELLLAEMRGEIHASPQQIYTARVLYENEPPEPDAEKLNAETDGVAEYLIAELLKRRQIRSRERHRLVRELLVTGRAMTEEDAARLGLVLLPDDEQPKLLQ
jgi:hypothetical protein